MISFLTESFFRMSCASYPSTTMSQSLSKYNLKIPLALWTCGAIFCMIDEQLVKAKHDLCPLTTGSVWCHYVKCQNSQKLWLLLTTSFFRFLLTISSIFHDYNVHFTIFYWPFPLLNNIKVHNIHIWFSNSYNGS